MTAVVGVINQTGAAIAADSAVTMTRSYNRKIANNANKMIRLSNHQPIGVMIYNNGGFMGCAWDIIIRHYRKLRGDLELPMVRTYIDDFIQFLHENNFFVLQCQEDRFKSRLAHEFVGFCREIDRSTIMPDYSEPDDEFNMTISNREELIESYKEEAGKVAEHAEKHPISPEFADYTIDQLSAYLQDSLEEIQKNSSIPDEIFSEVYPMLLEKFLPYATGYNEDDYSGLIFTGYGADQKYPSSICVCIRMAFDNRLVYYIRPEDEIHITEDRPSAICRYAQTDVMDTLMSGISGLLKEEIRKTSVSILNHELNHLIDTAIQAGLSEKQQEKQKSMDLSEFNGAMDKFLTTLMEEEATKRFIKPIEGYSLDDMASLAENLVGMTSLHRHLSFEDEGVGGLVDLAIISRENGFEWKNRKSWYQDSVGKHSKMGI